MVSAYLSNYSTLELDTILTSNDTLTIQSNVVIDSNLHLDNRFYNKKPHFRSESDSIIDYTIVITQADSFYQVTKSGSDTIFVVTEYVKMPTTWLGNDTFGLPANGDYDVYAKVVAEVNTNDRLIVLDIYNVTQGQRLEGFSAQVSRGSNDWFTLGGFFYCNACNNGDKLIMRISNFDNTDNIEIKHAQWWIDLNHYNY